ncbi:hypothetical protein BU17DRAFT_68469 [Hysterangium stoloniferum]|nr:hypothetical protein BU17DRAFT_68469 [Hysterangium stoloniferum]
MSTPSSSSSTPYAPSTPQPQYLESASPHALSSSVSKNSKVNAARTKPTNVFSNDGTFLERFQRLKREEEEKKKTEQDATRKLQFEERFKKRGKRPTPDTPATTHDADDLPSKKLKIENDAPLMADVSAQYEKDVHTYAGRSLKDNGTGIRPLVK